MNTGLVITAPSALLQFCANMEAMQSRLNAQISPIIMALDQIAEPFNRAQKFIVEQYAKSPLAKKRAAKINLTNAVNAALARARKTWHEVAESFETHRDATQLFTSSPPALAQHFAANAPNERATHRLNTGSMRALTLER